MQWSVIEHFREQHREWLVNGSFTPVSTMVRWMTYGKGIRSKEGGMPKVLWEASRETFRFLGQRIHVRDFQQMAQRGLQDTEALLDELMFGPWAEVQSRIDLMRIQDSLVHEGNGASFATDERNAWLDPGYRFLLRRCQGQLCTRGGGTWHMQPVLAHLRTLKRLDRQLARDAHIWAGQPGRGKEVMTMKHCDTQQALRNAFVFAGQVLFITDRDKNRAIRGFRRKVARFLPERLGRMVVAWISWLIPFARFLRRKLKIAGWSMDTDAYMWKGGSASRSDAAWTTEVLTDELNRLTAEHLGWKLGTADYRHVAILLGREIKGVVIRRMAVEMGEGGDDEKGGEEGGQGERWDYVWDLQSTHGRTIAMGHYAVDARFPYQLQPEMMMNFCEISRL